MTNERKTNAWIGPLPVLLSTAAALLLASSMFGQAPNGPVTHTVVIKNMSFNPAQLNVRVGDKVEWKNQDIFAHTATADDGSFDSGLVQPGQSWSTTIAKSSTIGYHCRPHPNMTAALIASAAASTSQRAPSPRRSLMWLPPTSPEEIHPILVNFTAALLPLAFLSDVLGRIFRRQSLHNAAWWMLLYAALITPLTAAAGWWWKRTAGPGLPPELITVHQCVGTLAALIFIGLAAWRWTIYKRGATPSAAYLACALLTVFALMYQGSIGGRMLFGK